MEPNLSIPVICITYALFSYELILNKKSSKNFYSL